MITIAICRQFIIASTPQTKLGIIKACQLLSWPFHSTTAAAAIESQRRHRHSLEIGFIIYIDWRFMVFADIIFPVFLCNRQPPSPIFILYSSAVTVAASIHSTITCRRVANASTSSSHQYMLRCWYTHCVYSRRQLLFLLWFFYHGYYYDRVYATTNLNTFNFTHSCQLSIYWPHSRRRRSHLMHLLRVAGWLTGQYTRRQTICLRCFVLFKKRDSDSSTSLLHVVHSICKINTRHTYE